MLKSVEEIIETIKALKGFTRDNQVADALGISPGALSNAKKRNSLSFFNELIKLCDKENYSLDILRRDPFLSSETLQIATTPGTIDEGAVSNFVKVNVFSLANGIGLEELADSDPIDTAVIPRELYSEDSLVVRMNGDSMEKLLMHGSNAIIDTSQKELVSGSIYALQIPHEGNIVRECYSDPRGLSLRPFNNNYPISKVGWEDFDPKMVIGKVSCTVINMFR